ncbi:MAG: 2-carboxy-1,4-naphthoquinone phytyltransferase [Phormidesmis sp.]
MTTHTAKPIQSSVNGLAGSNQNKADQSIGNMTAENAGDNRHRKKLWMAALKPPMYCVAIAPICIGSAVAYRQTGQFNPGTFTLFIAAAVLLLVWENLSNDVFDAATGIDQNKHHSLVNLTRNRSLIFQLSNLSLLLGVAGVFLISIWQQDVTVLALVLVCCALGYLYQGPPFRLGYQGLGEVLCFFSFGPLAVGAAYYAQTQTWKDAWTYGSALPPAALIIGVTTTLVLFCSHFHQVEDDLQAGKKSPVVRLGTYRAAQLLPWACGSVFTLSVLAIVQSALPLSTVLIWLSLPVAFKLCQHVLTFHDQPERVSNAKFLAIHFHFWSGLFLIAGLLLPALITL